jgi:hypothetical protein
VNFLERFIAKQAVKRMAKEIEVSGWKTRLAGIAAILTGGGAAMTAILDADFSGAWEGWLILIGGLTALGLGHKLDKLTATVKSAPANQAERPPELTG